MTQAAAAPWYEELARNARTHGALPYVVDGFTEIVDAVRRGHAVLVRREQAEVADGVVVFEDGQHGIAGAFGPRISDRVGASDEGSPAVVAILRFEPASARFVLQDPATTAGSVQLTPRRLQRYLDDPRRSTGVALGL